MRPLAFTGPKRSPDLPDVPTMTESGYPEVGYNPDVWLGVLAPIGTPAAIVEKLNREVNATLKSEEMARRSNDSATRQRSRRRRNSKRSSRAN